MRIGVGGLIVTVLALGALRDVRAEPREREGGPARRDDLAGIARRPDGRPLAFVQVRVRDSAGHERVDETLEDGRFRVSGLLPGMLWIKAYLLGCPDSGEATVVERVSRTGVEDLALPFDVGHELTVRVQAAPFAHAAIDEGAVIRIGGRAHSPARLYLQDPALPEGRRTLTYHPAIEDGALRFRRVRPGLAWTLWIPWSRDVRGTLLETGAALVAGERTVTLEPGAPIGVMLEWPPMAGAGHAGSGPARRAVSLRRGPVLVPVSLDSWEGQAGTSPPVPLGVWTVTAYDVLAQGGRHEAREEVEAGGSVWLDLRPVRAPSR